MTSEVKPLVPVSCDRGEIPETGIYTQVMEQLVSGKADKVSYAVYISFLDDKNGQMEVRPLSVENVHSWQMGPISELSEKGFLAAVGHNEHGLVLYVHKKTTAMIEGVNQRLLSLNKNLPPLILDPNYKNLKKKKLGRVLSLVKMTDSQSELIKTVFDSFQQACHVAYRKKQQQRSRQEEQQQVNGMGRRNNVVSQRQQQSEEHPSMPPSGQPYGGGQPKEQQAGQRYRQKCTIL